MTELPARVKKIRPARYREVFTYRLSVTPEQVIERLTTQGGIPELAAEEATRPPAGEPYLVRTEGGFMIRAPGSASEKRLREVGPAIEGHIVESKGGKGGTEVRLRVVAFAPTKSQSAKYLGAFLAFVLTSAGLASQGLAALPFFGLTVLAIALAGTMYLLGEGQRRDKTLELLAVVQRAFGPVALSELDEPYRQRARALVSAAGDDR